MLRKVGIFIESSAAELFANFCFAKTVALWLGLCYAPTNITAI